MPVKLKNKHLASTLISSNSKEMYWTLLFILPAGFIFCFFILYPLFHTILYSFTDWSGFSETVNFVGLSNHMAVLTDPKFYKSMLRSAYFTVIHVIVGAGVGLLFAVMIGQVRWGKSIFRTLFFFPRMLSLAVVGLTWSQLYHPNIGLINSTLKMLGLDFLANAWLGNSSTALTSVAIASSWHAYGFYMVIFLASLQLIDKQLYESAVIDGANAWQQFWSITIPSLYNTISMVLVLAFISGLRAFGSVWAMTKGGPVDATELIMVYIWRDAFENQGKSGYSLAASTMFGIFIVVVTSIFNQLRERKKV
jgi:raffinose/stachyose/melibiose transport system permease protein